MDDVLLLLTTLNTIRTWGRVQHRLVHQHSSGSSRIFERFKTDMNQTNTLMSIHQLQRTAIKRLCLLDDFPVWTLLERDYRDAQVTTQLARHMWINLPKYSPKSWYWCWCYMGIQEPRTSAFRMCSYTGSIWVVYRVYMGYKVYKIFKPILTGLCFIQ